MTDASINFDLLARDRASDKFQKVGKAADNASSKLQKLGGAGKKIGLGLAAGAVLAGVGVAKFAKGAISEASDLNETLSKSRVIFGQQAGAMEKWASHAATAAGLSKQAALDSAASFGDMFRQIGFAGDASAKMSKNVVQLAADLGSFNNLPTGDVLEMIAGGFRGEYDALQRVIPNISAARVQTEALNATGKKNAAQLTAQEKAAATLAIIQKDGARATGDFARTSKGLANQQKILAAKFDNVKAKIGSVLLPAMTSVVSFANDKLMPAFSRVSKRVKNFFTEGVGGDALKKAMEGVRAGADQIRQGFVKAADAVGRIKDAIGGIDLNNLDGNKIGKALGDAVLSGLQRLGQLAGKIGDTIGKMFDKVDWVGLGIMIGKQAPALVVGLISGIAAFDPIALFKQVAAHWQTVLVAALTIAFMPAKFAGVLEKILVKIPFVGKFLAVALRWVNDLGGKLKSFGADLLRTFWRGFTSTPIPGVSFVTKVIRAIAGLPGALSSFWRSIQTRMGVWALDAFEAAGRGARTGINKLVKFVATIPGKIVSALGNVGSLLTHAGNSIIESLLGPLRAGAEKVKGILKTITDKIPDWKGPLDRDKTLLTPAGEAIMQSLINGFKKKWTPVKDFLQKVTDKVKETGDKLAGLVSQRNDFANSFRGFSSSIFGRDPGQDAEGNAIPESVAGIKAFAAKQRAEAERLARNVQRLVSLGLSKDLISQLQSTGSSGIAQINALAAGGSRADIAFLNAQNAATAAADVRAGMSAGNAIYGSAIAKAKADADTAKAVADAVAKALHPYLDRELVAKVQGDDIIFLIRRTQKKKGHKVTV